MYVSGYKKTSQIPFVCKKNLRRLVVTVYREILVLIDTDAALLFVGTAVGSAFLGSYFSFAKAVGKT